MCIVDASVMVMPFEQITMIITKQERLAEKQMVDRSP